MYIKLKQMFIDTALFLEKTLFPILFFLFSLDYISQLHNASYKIIPLIIGLPKNNISYEDLLTISNFLTLLVLILINTLVMVGLLTQSKLRQKPDRIIEIILPFFCISWNLAYNFFPIFSPEINFIILPQKFLQFSLWTGVLLTALGCLWSSVAIIQMRKSFSIFVEVREIITNGLYRYVRHPIYFGHILTHIGFFLINPRIYYFLLSILLFIFTIWRARLEEEKLSQYSVEYQRYVKKTPFLIPLKLSWRS